MNTCESTVVNLPSDILDSILFGYPDVSIAGSRMLPDLGIELLVEGDRIAVNNLLLELDERQNSYRTAIEQGILVLEELEEIPF